MDLQTMLRCLMTPVQPIALGYIQKIVNQRVPEPYLDEVFHVGQAQTYCQGRFAEWDPKITTPPGLYLLSYLVFRATGNCDIVALRLLSSASLYVLSLCASFLLERTSTSYRKRGGSRESSRQSSFHGSNNIALFPPLFFFAFLYYTDVVSTTAVLTSLICSVKWQNRDQRSPLLFSMIVLSGLFALACRQTNIFWVAVFPAGQVIVNLLKAGPNAAGVAALPPGASIADILRWTWRSSRNYDVPIEVAYLEDYIMTALSLVVAVFKNLRDIIVVASPYFMLLASFAGFIVINGGVVLGDKSNHMATIHLSQMLYIWPYITFFSFPLMIQHPICSLVNSMSPHRTAARSSKGRLTSGLPRLWTLALFTVLATAIVQTNTIVHPFILADNRHYVFYVFRILLRHPAIKYAVAPIYVLTGWLSIRALGGGGGYKKWTDRRDQMQNQQQQQTREEEGGAEGQSTSFVLVWLVTSALSLCGAPLVEPRYFILPWLTWRLHVPVHPSSAAPLPPPSSSTDRARQTAVAQKIGSSTDQDSKVQSGIAEKIAASIGSPRVRLWGETMWFLFVNAATLSMFLYKPFAWPQEPGKAQRFMW